MNGGTCDDDASNDCVQDCAGEWGGDAVIDDCGVCDGGNADNLGCGCFEPAAFQMVRYCFDADSDGLGAGDSQDFCFRLT